MSYPVRAVSGCIAGQGLYIRPINRDFIFRDNNSLRLCLGKGSSTEGGRVRASGVPSVGPQVPDQLDLKLTDPGVTAGRSLRAARSSEFEPEGGFSQTLRIGLEAPVFLPIGSLAMMVRGVTEQEDGTVYMTITEPGASAFPDIFEHRDRVYGKRISPDEEIKLGSVVAYVFRRGERESNLQIGRVIAGPGCQVNIHDRIAEIVQEKEDSSEYPIFEPDIRSSFWIDPKGQRYLIMTETSEGEQIFLNIDGVSPLLVHRDLVRFQLTRVHGYRVVNTPRFEDVQSSVRQANVQGKWDLRLVKYRGEIHTVNAIGPSQRVDEDGRDLVTGDLLISKVPDGPDLVVPIQDIEARVVVYEREL